MPSRSRRRWAIAGGVAAVWIILLAVSHSIVGGTALLLLISAVAVGSFLALRYLGIDRDHPWVQRAATRPWRDGRDVLQLALRHLSEVFVITPSGSLLAPNLVELRMNPADVAALTEVMELEVINSSASELYETKVAAHAARLASAGPVEVSVVADPAVPAGRYRLRQGRRASFAHAGHGAGAGAAAYAGGGAAYRAAAFAGGDGAASVLPSRLDAQAHARSAAPTLVRDVLTVTAPASPPLLRLVTNDSVAQTRVSGVRAGRGSEAELQLPDEPTVSRVHAEFTFTAGEWRITNLGRNGVLVNEMPVVAEHAVRDGDLISWGPHPGALVSRVEVC